MPLEGLRLLPFRETSGSSGVYEKPTVFQGWLQMFDMGPKKKKKKKKGVPVVAQWLMN